MTKLPEGAREAIIVCSDKRLRPTIDRLYNNGRRAIVSTAGANVAAVEVTVRRLTALGTRRWMVLTHSDSKDPTQGCGWAGRLAQELAAGHDRTRLAARYIEPEHVTDFVALGCTTRTSIEAQNLEIQTARLTSLLDGTGARTQPGDNLDTATMFSDQSCPDVLVVTVPSAARYSSLIDVLNAHASDSAGRVGPYNTYYSQVTDVEEALADVRLFTGALNVQDVRLLSLDEPDNDLMAQLKSRLAAEPYMRTARLSLVEPWRPVPRKSTS